MLSLLIIGTLKIMKNHNIEEEDEVPAIEDLLFADTDEVQVTKVMNFTQVMIQINVSESELL